MTDDARGIARDDRARGDIRGHDGTGADHGISTNRQSRKDRGVRADRRALANPRSQELWWPPAASRKLVIGKGGVRPHEYIVFDRHSVPELHTTFDRDSVADDDVVLNKGVVAYVAIIADDRTRKDVRERPNPGAFADPSRLNQGVGMDKRLRRVHYAGIQDPIVIRYAPPRTSPAFTLRTENP